MEVTGINFPHHRFGGHVDADIICISLLHNLRTAVQMVKPVKLWLVQHVLCDGPV